ncbi:hypothetical protein TraAM80_10189, partial [Trypanosoma rangeli]
RVGLPIVLLQRGICCRISAGSPPFHAAAPPRRLKKAETSAAALSGCAPCGPVVWQTVYIAEFTCTPHHVLGAAYICVAGDNAAASLLLFTGEQAAGVLPLCTSANCGAKCHCDEAVNFTVSG